jgi:hypothetical protein
MTLEVLRVCTDGTSNACSFLYARVKRIAALMGYRQVITYTIKEESGSSLKAVGARIVGEVQPKGRSVPSRPRKSQDVYDEPKWKWELLEGPFPSSAIFSQTDFRNFFRHPRGIQEKSEFVILKHKPTWAVHCPDGTDAPKEFAFHFPIPHLATQINSPP